MVDSDFFSDVERRAVVEINSTASDYTGITSDSDNFIGKIRNRRSEKIDRDVEYFNVEDIPDSFLVVHSYTLFIETPTKQSFYDVQLSI